MRTVEVTEELQAYLDGLVPPRDSVLARMEEEAERESIPIVDPHEGALLYLLVKIARAKRVLELGTATGTRVCSGYGHVSFLPTRCAPDHRRYHPGVGDHAHPATSQAGLRPTSHCTCPFSPRKV